MQALKAIGFFLLSVIIAAVIFAAVLLIAAAINHVGFYEQARLWFGSASTFGQLFKKA